MSDQTISSRIAYVRREAGPTRPAPILSRGVFAWVKENLFSTPMSGVLTIGSILFVLWLAPDTFRYLVTDAIWQAPDGVACRAPGAGACWAYVAAKFEFFMYGSYPRGEVWRVDVTLILGLVLILWLLTPRTPRKGLAAVAFFVVYPVVAFVLLRGLAGVLPLVDTNLWGGVFVSLLVAAVGIVASLPLGVLLALGRRSKLPFVKFFCVVFIEFVRGVPLITVLFMANTMLPLFVPQEWTPDRLLRPLIGVSLFAAAYMAEVVRAGLQAMPKGQFEGAMALGLPYWKMMRLIILPQALTTVIPGIVNSFIALFKDTTLVAIVGIFDFLRTVETARLDPVWAGPTISTTGYVFAAIFYWVFCFAMSRYSQMLERKLAAGRRR
jgi:general L-amino acid transport system permease protein